MIHFCIYRSDPVRYRTLPIPYVYANFSLFIVFTVYSTRSTVLSLRVEKKAQVTDDTSFGNRYSLRDSFIHLGCASRAPRDETVRLRIELSPSRNCLTAGKSGVVRSARGCASNRVAYTTSLESKEWRKQVSMGLSIHHVP